MQIKLEAVAITVAVPEETEGVKVVMVPVFEEKVPSGELQITEVNKPPRVAVKSMEPPVQTMFPPEIVAVGAAST